MRARTRLHPILSAGLAGTLAFGAEILLAGCGGGPANPDPSPTGTDATPTAGAGSVRAQLAARAAAAKDQRYSALYTLSGGGRPDRTVVATRATDGSWRVDIPAGALGGIADVSVARTRDGLYQCALSSAAYPVQPFCIRAAGPRGRLSNDTDPRVQHVFVDWLDVLTDRDAAIAVSAAKVPRGVRGSCYAIESNSASLETPLDVGIYCFDQDGTLTGVRLAFGTMVLSGQPAAAPRTVALPGPIVPGEPLSMASPPPPPTTEAPSPTATTAAAG